MRKFKYLLLSLFTFLFATSLVGAATCEYEERAKLNNETGNIKASYEVKERVATNATLSDEELMFGTSDASKTEDYIVINILNITDNMYVEVYNDYNKETITYNYANTSGGSLEIESPTVMEVVSYKITIKASAKTGCEDTVLRTINLILPRYNYYSEYAVCAKIPEYYLCSRYVDYDEVSFSTFTKNVSEEIEKLEQEEQNDNNKNRAWYQKAWDYVVEHKTPFIIGGASVVVIAGAIVTIMVIKRRRDEI